MYNTDDNDDDDNNKQILDIRLSRIMRYSSISAKYGVYQGSVSLRKSLAPKAAEDGRRTGIGHRACRWKVLWDGHLVRPDLSLLAAPSLSFLAQHNNNNTSHVQTTVITGSGARSAAMYARGTSEWRQMQVRDRGHATERARERLQDNAYVMCSICCIDLCFF